MARTAFGSALRLLLVLLILRRSSCLECQLTTEATSSSTGSITSTGGLGLAKKLVVGTDAKVEGTADIVGNTKITGTADITGNTAITGTITCTDATESTSKTTGALKTAGGVGIAKNVHVGGTADITGNTKITGTADITGAIACTDATESTSKTTGALKTAGGVGIAKNVHVGGTVDITGDFSAANGAFSGTLTKGGANVATDASDRRLKRDIARIESSAALDTIKSLTGVSFRFRTEEFPEKGLDPKEQVGFIAQEVEEILPQVVNTFDDGFKGIEYGKVTAVLVEAVKQQAGEIVELRAALLAQQREMAWVRAALAKQKLLPPWD
eukprot:g2510.t1